MRVLAIIAALACAGCTAPKTRVPAPSTVAVTRSVERAKESASRAGESVSTAKAAVADLERTASPEQREPVRVVKAALEEATRELEVIHVSLARGSEETLLLQTRIDGMAADYGAALDKERTARAAANRWRKWALYLSLISGGLAFWIFRKPILRACGLPIF